VIIHSGTVIGSDGFGFVTHQGRHDKILQIGTVVIEDDVEIGSNVSVDRSARPLSNEARRLITGPDRPQRGHRKTA
jgi:hypothetical protein